MQKTVSDQFIGQQLSTIMDDPKLLCVCACVMRVHMRACDISVPTCVRACVRY